MGATITPDGTQFSVWSRHAERIELCLFSAIETGIETRLPMAREGDVHTVTVPDLSPGTLYGFRAHGRYAPEDGFWFDPSKVLVDPYAIELDRAFVYDPLLSEFGTDTAHLVPKARMTALTTTPHAPPIFRKGGLIYEIAVRGFTMLHQDIPESQRGTVAALAHPAIIAHLKRIGVSAVELMPITAWIDERHLRPLGLTNSWGYNPVALMALDPRLVPGGVDELRDTVSALHDAGIGVILDLVFNHTGESDRFGPTLSMRGLDNLTYYSHAENNPGILINDTGCGNTLACHQPVVQQLVLDTLRHFVTHSGVDGFRFDLAPIMGRDASGFHANAPLISALLTDPVLQDRILIAEPWDIGPGGYQLGQFPPAFLEWNDRARDDIRRFWRGDSDMVGALATRLAGSSDVFSGNRTRTVNFLAAHDGFTLMDLVSYTTKHNHANGEDNRDGHNDNHSWNNGVEGESDDPTVHSRRRNDVMALLSTLFATRGTIMLTAGDEGGRTQHGNNNAYAQDNTITWLDWSALDEALIAHTADLSAIRQRNPALTAQDFLTENDSAWLRPDGQRMTTLDWQNPQTNGLTLLLTPADASPLAILINRAETPQAFTLPHPYNPLNGLTLAARSVAFFETDLRV